MLKRAGAASITYVAYVLLLLAFVLLGVFVAALAHESRFAAVAGAVLVASLAASITGFRVGASKLARTSEAAGSASSATSTRCPRARGRLAAHLG